VIALECEVRIGECALSYPKLNGLGYLRSIRYAETRKHLLYPGIVRVIGAELK
jgi:hypothetical protein